MYVTKLYFKNFKQTIEIVIETYLLNNTFLLPDLIYHILHQTWHSKSITKRILHTHISGLGLSVPCQK